MKRRDGGLKTHLGDVPVASEGRRKVKECPCWEGSEEKLDSATCSLLVGL